MLFTLWPLPKVHTYVFSPDLLVAVDFLFFFFFKFLAASNPYIFYFR